MDGLKIGSKLQKGKYEITKVLGSGNFGITYLASTKIAVKGQMGQMDVTVNVAIKEFYMKDLNNRTSDGTTVEGTQNTMVKNYRQKFRKEAENLAKLHHPNIIKVIEVFDENNTTYYVMEYIEGGSLDDYIKSKGRLTEEEALQCTLVIADALSYMHKNMMIHLDLKPKNIMRNSKGHLYLIDFGLSKQYDENGEPESSTSIGLGTPGYAPLEQASYKQDGTLPVTLDIYALGASLFKMLTGKTPPEASYVLNEGLPLDSLKQARVSVGTISVVEKAMSPMKKERYQTVSSLSEAISCLSKDNEQTSYPEKAESTKYDEEVEAEVEDSQIEKKCFPKTDITNNVPLKKELGGIRIRLMLGLGIVMILFLSTISNIPLEIRDTVGYRTGDAEDFLIKNWNIGIIGLCFSILCTIYYIYSNRKVVSYIAIAVATISIVFLLLFINSEKDSTSDAYFNIESVNLKEIDLGLPSGTIWAGWNIGANKADDYGTFYSWGALSPYKKEGLRDYYSSLSTLYADSVCISRNGIISGSEYDVAYKNWGEDWRIPTKEQADELFSQCEWKWGSFNGCNGMIGKGPNGNLIFFPATGYSNENGVWSKKKEGNYWCGDLCNPSKHDHSNYHPSVIEDAENSKRANCYSFSNTDHIHSGCSDRYFGYAIRPVKK